MNCSPSDSFIHGILQARILEWVAISSSRSSSWPRDQTWVSCIAGGFFTIWATRDSFRDCLIIKKHNQGLVEVRPWTSNQVVRVLAWQCHLLAGCLFSEILLSSSIWGVVVLRRSWIFNWEWLSLWENVGLVNVLPDVNLNKIFCFKNGRMQGNWFVRFECSFTFIYNLTLRIISFPLFLLLCVN